MAICFNLLQVLAQSEKTTPSVVDRAIQKGLSEHISTRCVLKQAELQINTHRPHVS